ncbi:MAG TPA: hypothetical protein VGB81_08690 [Devosia sp.]
MTNYRVVDCRSAIIDPNEIIISQASSPEDAAFKAMGETLVRSGRRSDLRARVYFQHPNQPMSMVRLYSKAVDRASPANASASAVF